MRNVTEFTDPFGNTGDMKSLLLVTYGTFRPDSAWIDDVGHTIVYSGYTPYLEFYVVPSGIKRQLRNYIYGTMLGIDSCGTKAQRGDLVLVCYQGKLKYGVVYSDTQILLDIGVVESCIMLVIPRKVWRKTEKEAYAQLVDLYHNMQKKGKEPKRGDIFVVQHVSKTVYYVCLGKIKVYEDKVGVGESLKNINKPWGYLRLPLNTERIKSKDMINLKSCLYDLNTIFSMGGTDKVPWLLYYKSPKKDINVLVGKADTTGLTNFYVDLSIGEVSFKDHGSADRLRIELV